MVVGEWAAFVHHAPRILQQRFCTFGARRYGIGPFLTNQAKRNEKGSGASLDIGALSGLSELA